MSIVVRGMEMPDNCEDCAIQYDYMDCPVCGDGWYSSNNQKRGFNPETERLPECPLFELKDWKDL